MLDPIFFMLKFGLKAERDIGVALPSHGCGILGSRCRRVLILFFSGGFHDTLYVPVYLGHREHSIS